MQGLDGKVSFMILSILELSLLIYYVTLTTL